MINDAKLDTLRRSIDDLSNVVDDAEELADGELNSQLKHMEVTVNEFLAEIRELEDAVSEAKERAEDEGEDEDTEDGEEEDEEEEEKD